MSIASKPLAHDWCVTVNASAWPSPSARQTSCSGLTGYGPTTGMVRAYRTYRTRCSWPRSASSPAAAFISRAGSDASGSRPTSLSP